MNVLKTRHVILLALPLGTLLLFAQQPVGDDLRNLRLVNQSSDGSEVTLTVDYSYDGHSGASARLLPIIADKTQQKVSSWFGADPVTLPVGHGTISVKVKFFNDEPDAPKQLTTDRVRMMMLTEGGGGVIAQSSFSQTIKWGVPPTGQPVQAAAEAQSNQAAEAARVKAEQEKQAAEAKVKADADALAKARAKAEQERIEAEAKVKAASQALAEARAKLEAEQKAAEAKARADSEARIKAEQERLVAQARAKAEAEAKAKAEAQARAETEAARIKAEQERLAADAKAKAEAEAKARAEAEAARIKAEQERLAAVAQAKAKAEAEAARIKAEQERLAAVAKAKAEAEAARAKAEQERLVAEAKAKAEAEAKARAEAEAARIKAEQERLAAEAKAKADAEAIRAKAEQERLAVEAKAKAEAEANAAAETRLAAEAKARAEAQARELARLQAEQDRLVAEAKAKAAEAARLKAEQEKLAAATPAPPPKLAPPAQTYSFVLAPNRHTRVSDVDIVSRSMDRTELTLSVEYDVAQEEGRPRIGVDFASTELPEVSKYFTSSVSTIGNDGHNSVLIPVKLGSTVSETLKRSTFPTDKVWIYLADSAGEKSYIFQGSLMLLWHVPGSAHGDGAPTASQNTASIDIFKQNDFFSGYVIVKYNTSATSGRLHLRVYDSANPAIAGWFASDDVRLRPGPGMQLVKVAVSRDAQSPDVFKANTLEIQLIDSKGEVLATGTKQTAMTWAKPK